MLRTDIVLRDGSTLLLRPVGPDDEGALHAFYDRLSPESRYSRFFSSRDATPAEVARLMRADAGTTLVAELNGSIVGAASYTRSAPESESAEVAFAVDDKRHGLGIGTRLLEGLADLARCRHLRAFDAFVLGDNTEMLRMFQDSGFTISQRVDAGVCHVRISLEPTERATKQTAVRSRTAATASMRAIFEPRSVAVIGANRERGRIGSEILHNLRAGGYTGRLTAVHPAASSIDGVPAYPAVSGIPGPVDLAVICVPAAAVNAVVDDCVHKGVHAVVVISAGFGETGAAGRQLEDELVQKVRRAGIRLIGPNCMGLINTSPAVRMNATFAPVDPPPGRVALSTQSGALGLAILDYARELNIGFSTFVSVGNKADVSGNDLLQYWETDPRTAVILLYLESFGNPRKFTEIARRIARTKPIVAVKAGRSRAGARAASSHTGALAARDAVVDALFHQSGVIRTNRLEELFDVAALLANQPLPAGRRVGILTNAGGPAILAADACEAQGLDLPPLSEGTAARLRSFLPAAASIGNPVDMIASASAADYERAVTALLADDQIDAALVIFIPPVVTRGEDVAAAIRRATSAAPAKPVLAIFMSAEPVLPLLTPVPCFRFPEAAASALARAARYAEWRRQPAGHVPAFPDFDRATARAIVEPALRNGDGWLAPGEASALLTTAGIQAAPGRVAVTEEDAVAAADQIGYPVVMKASGPAILHKTELDAVRLNLASADEVRVAWRELHGRLGDRMTGALIQKMIVGGVEMLMGAVDDPTFGPVIACATGGTLTELMDDSQVRVHPLTDVDAAEMVNGLRGAALLRGYRGRPAADLAAFQEAVLRLSALIDVCPEIRELDVNPLLVLASGVVALDVRVRVAPLAPPPATRRVSY